MLVALLAVCAAAAEAGAGQMRGAGRGGRNLLLREIKDNLRQDNEDYELVHRRTGGPATPPARPPGTNQPGGAQMRAGAPPAWPGPVLPGARPAAVAPTMQEQATAAVPIVAPKSRQPPVKPGRNQAKQLRAAAPPASLPGPVMRASDLDKLAEDLDAVGIVDLPAEADVRMQVAAVTSAVRRHARRPAELEGAGAGAGEAAGADASPASFQLQPIQPSPRPRGRRPALPRAHAAPPPGRPVGRQGPPADPAGLAQTATTTGAADKKNKLERFVVFINKNRELLKQFILNKRAQQATATQAPSLRIAGERVKGGVNGGVGAAIMDGLRGVRARDSSDVSSSDDVGFGADKGGDTGVTGGGAPFKWRPHHKLDGKQLDLAPARGSAINNMREKGRICSRYVLNPEGPKYNSRGHTYKPEYELKPGRAFIVTKPPRFLLPICCNCCQKSVLGCE